MEEVDPSENLFTLKVDAVDSSEMLVYIEDGGNSFL
jgi:hypothetical protein